MTDWLNQPHTLTNLQALALAVFMVATIACVVHLYAAVNGLLASLHKKD